MNENSIDEKSDESVNHHNNHSVDSISIVDDENGYSEYELKNDFDDEKDISADDIADDVTEYSENNDGTYECILYTKSLINLCILIFVL